MLIFLFFFFSSRRRHTRSYGDWSSDVCSSDLHPTSAIPSEEATPAIARPAIAGEASWRSESSAKRARTHACDNTPPRRVPGSNSPGGGYQEVEANERNGNLAEVLDLARIRAYS